ncbi:uncharacterized protein CLUP02_15706 [Colletotrichum lupini]|uniref:Uncharacterized protein n=1 Tax=Colletotrichum lupini TaxID=145971 RepID=A0A9Q8T8W3_9PEZI|nr:uncharacterized protein CLUP02_15706 [Colletotrichum lupini]UQC90176.1 hypothetical protein CLUP02_15706 [Colletotrichum lupini]
MEDVPIDQYSGESSSTLSRRLGSYHTWVWAPNALEAKAGERWFRALGFSLISSAKNPGMVSILGRFGVWALESPPYSMFVSLCWDVNGRGKALSDTYLDSWRRSTGLGRIRLRHSNRPQPGELASSCLLLRFIAALHGGPGSFYGVDMSLRGPTGPKGVKMTRRLAGGSSDSFDNGRETFPAPRPKVPVPAIRSINNDIEPIYSKVADFFGAWVLCLECPDLARLTKTLNSNDNYHSSKEPAAAKRALHISLIYTKHLPKSQNMLQLRCHLLNIAGAHKQEKWTISIQQCMQSQFSQECFLSIGGRARSQKFDKVNLGIRDSQTRLSTPTRLFVLSSIEAPVLRTQIDKTKLNIAATISPRNLEIALNEFVDLVRPNRCSSKKGATGKIIVLKATSVEYSTLRHPSLCDHAVSQCLQGGFFAQMFPFFRHDIAKFNKFWPWPSRQVARIGLLEARSPHREVVYSPNLYTVISPLYTSLHLRLLVGLSRPAPSSLDLPKKEIEASKSRDLPLRRRATRVSLLSLPPRSPDFCFLPPQTRTKKHFTVSASLDEDSLLTPSLFLPHRLLIWLSLSLPFLKSQSLIIVRLGFLQISLRKAKVQALD